MRKTTTRAINVKVQAVVTLDLWVNQALQLKTLMAERECDYFQFLMDGEINRPLWQGDPMAGTGYTTFAELLVGRLHQDIQKFEKFKECVQKVGLPALRTIGLAAGEKLLPIPMDLPSRTQPTRLALEAALDDLKTDRVKNGVPPGAGAAQHAVYQHYEAPKKPKTPYVPNPVEEANKEILKLRKEVEQLRKENEILKVELDLALAKLENKKRS